MALLDVRNLCIDIKTANGKIRIVDNVNLTINEEDVYALVGESGSGKSLIAKVICNAVKDDWIISADRFRFNDIELLKLSPAKRRKLVGREISLIYQDPLTYLDPSKTIGDQLIQSIPNWTFKGKWWRWFGWKKRRVVELLHRVGIRDHKDIMRSYPNEITEGEGQKVMIAMAIANQPRLLIADEATTALGTNTQSQIYRLLLAMNQNHGTTILFLSSDLVSVSEWCETINILYCGQSVESGPREIIMNSPFHPYTMALMNSNPDYNIPLAPKTQLNALPGMVPLLTNIPIGCRLGPRCPFSQRKCVVKPPLRKIKQHEYACYYPLNIRVHSETKEKVEPITIQATLTGKEE